MRQTLELKAVHRHPTLGELDISFIVDSSGDLRLHSIQLTQEVITDHQLVSRRNYTVYFSGDNRRATFAQWKDPWNGTHNAGEVDSEPFLDDLNAFADSATLRRIMRRKLDAGLRALTTARQDLG